ncbi:MAG TPA: hypothetical protein VFF48_07595 [Brevundimonas sp.]|nr:hypothetical protein [Brevundimonas sp.]
MARALKVFCFSDGFHAWTVATPSRAKALAAWGVKRDLFKDGSAREVVEGGDREAALAAPGELIERGLMVDIGEIEKTRAPKPKPARAPDAKDVARVEELEAELPVLEARQSAERSDMDERLAVLERERAALSERHDRALEDMKTRLKAARTKLRP